MESRIPLIGKNVFITGGSRIIGLAISMACARDSANIAIAVKTSRPHPKLPVTIYDAVAEIESLDVRCIPHVLDVRDETGVSNAIEITAAKMGGTRDFSPYDVSPRAPIQTDFFLASLPGMIEMRGDIM